ncbi:acetyl-CoA acetyltransferase [Frankia sp. CNm7]|uniref:Acetyl-CoA acetyltransferase n=1 Tax=Frankia nepalensis TaxID=1836974 RepID=A0A937RGM9_9ACTN|nr:acetyl-CoA acetyltransferase [Frankia nepalensis]MBL7500030.1 acetyl-CoA acetyltransferase [Frankia nepalensis]MBL7511541.1 acetyl-CoA acetyltransferase [Frankia nepalensis]MBL7521005.1 acetyl-CoA acetyltransferase [Frankia nepalensis]MBL7628519.1 acetyl-CoA acetyltransferase [Frankia nepalensis]
MSGQVAVVGAALSDCGRVDGATPFALHYQAAARALADAGLSHADVDGFGSTGLGVLQPVELAEYLGLRPTWVDSTAVGGSTWEVMLEHAVDAIRAGTAHTVLLVYGSTARADLKKRLRTANLSLSTRGPSQFEAPWGHTLIAKYAMTARRHMHEFGTTIEQLANIAVDTRHNASLNPDAMYRDPLTVDDVLSAPMVATPFTKLHCCIRSDGGGAVVLTSAERAADLPRPAVRVLGTGTASNVTTMSEWTDFTVSPAAVSGKLAFERAGLSPADVDVCQFYDSFTSTVLLTFEALGFCGRGEGGAYLEGGTMRVGGRMPTNTDGGGLSACHPGMRGIFLLVEAVRQLRGEAAGRQVPNARVACVNGTGGWFSSTSTVLLGLD